MKKIIPVLLLTLIISLFTAACGNSDVQDSTPAETVQETTESETAAPTPEASAEPEQEPASSEDTENSDVDGKALALSMMDEEVSGLIDVIGEPNSSDYSPSCLGPGEDGELHYDNFTVYTYKEGDSEVIIDVDD